MVHDQLFWRNLVLLTAINIALSVVALILLGMKLSLAVVLAMHFAPVPYNIFLTFAVWRTGKIGGAKASMMMLGSALWLILVVVV